MRDRATRRRSTNKQQVIWMPERILVDHWRRYSRLAVLRELADGAAGLTLSRRLLDLLLEELHINDDFDVLVGAVARLRASQYPRLLAIALLVRHSWRPQDLARTAARLGLSRSITSSRAHRTRESFTSRDRGHRDRGRRRAPPAGPRTR